MPYAKPETGGRLSNTPGQRTAKCPSSEQQYRVSPGRFNSAIRGAQLVIGSSRWQAGGLTCFAFVRALAATNPFCGIDVAVLPFVRLRVPGVARECLFQE